MQHNKDREEPAKRKAKPPNEPRSPMTDFHVFKYLTERLGPGVATKDSGSLASGGIRFSRLPRNVACLIHVRVHCSPGALQQAPGEQY